MIYLQRHHSSTNQRQCRDHLMLESQLVSYYPCSYPKLPAQEMQMFLLPSLFCFRCCLVDYSISVSISTTQLHSLLIVKHASVWAWDLATCRTLFCNTQSFASHSITASRGQRQVWSLFSLWSAWPQTKKSRQDTWQIFLEHVYNNLNQWEEYYNNSYNINKNNNDNSDALQAYLSAT